MPARSASTSSSPEVGVANPAQSRSNVVLPEPLGPVTTKKPPRGSSKSTPWRTLVAVALGEAAGADHVATSRSTEPKKTMLITPFSVKNAVLRRRRSPGDTMACSYASRPATAPTPSQ